MQESKVSQKLEKPNFKVSETIKNDIMIKIDSFYYYKTFDNLVVANYGFLITVTQKIEPKDLIDPFTSLGMPYRLNDAIFKYPQLNSFCEFGTQSKVYNTITAGEYGLMTAQLRYPADDRQPLGLVDLYLRNSHGLPIQTGYRLALNFVYPAEPGSEANDYDFFK
jgi:hypothetical protein